MDIFKGYKYRLYPTTEQEKICRHFCGATRFVYNKILAMNQGRYILSNKDRLSWFDAKKFLPLWKRTEELGWLNEIDSQVLQEPIKSLESAYKKVFKGLGCPPTFHKKGTHNSFTYPQRFKVDEDNVYLPKIGWIKFKKSREIRGGVKSVTVSMLNGKWFVSFLTKEVVEDPPMRRTGEVGIDLGIANFAALSDGTIVLPINPFRSVENKLAKAQQKLSIKKKFSNNWKKHQRKVGSIHTKIANTRQDFLHKLSAQISKNHAVIVVEDLKIKNMSRSAKGTIEEPGRMVAAKSGLNKSILDQGWRAFRTMLEYKQSYSGGELIAVPPQYTSQECSNCHHVSKENRQQQSLFSCVECGYRHNADINASKNILARGLRESLNAYRLAA